MQAPSQSTAPGVNALQVATGRCALCACTITNNGSTPRYYWIGDASGAWTGARPQGVALGPVAPGQTANVPPLDSHRTISFATGCRVQAYTDAALTTPAPADSTITAWSGPH